MRYYALMRALLLLPLAVLTAAAPGDRTRITSLRDAQRLSAAKCVTLQWTNWNTRGSVCVGKGPVWLLSVAQAQAGGPGRVRLDGTVTETG